MENITLSYKISLEERLEGYDIYYRVKKRKFTFIKAAAFAIMLILFIQQVIMNPKYTLGWICIIVCLGAIACIFATPKMERKNYGYANEALKDDVYRFEMSKDKILVSTVLPDSDEKYLDIDKEGNAVSQPEIQPTAVDMTDRKFSAYESENVFTVSDSGAFFTVPKSGLSKYEEQELRDRLKPVPIAFKK